MPREPRRSSLVSGLAEGRAPRADWPAGLPTVGWDPRIPMIHRGRRSPEQVVVSGSRRSRDHVFEPRTFHRVRQRPGAMTGPRACVSLAEPSADNGSRLVRLARPAARSSTTRRPQPARADRLARPCPLRDKNRCAVSPLFLPTHFSGRTRTAARRSLRRFLILRAVVHAEDRTSDIDRPYRIVLTVAKVSPSHLASCPEHLDG
jgi:hypothetical protein